MSKKSETRIAELVALLQIPNEIQPNQYPRFNLNYAGNMMFDIGIATNAWRHVNRDVAKRIFPVISEHCQSSEECEQFLEAISKQS